MNHISQISGDGKLDQSAAIPGSDKSTRFDSLEIYLVSYQTKLNLTVSSGPSLLAQEQGSTVKHFNYNVLTCIPAGSYNVSAPCVMADACPLANLGSCHHSS